MLNEVHNPFVGGSDIIGLHWKDGAGASFEIDPKAMERISKDVGGLARGEIEHDPIHERWKMNERMQATHC